ncbi:MAG TPA: hypothetical protein VKV39_09810 [Candidatus Sulfotelmatobacter sp.]|nr:hypothetical protein [Candidatus Sulfotelmatobacter sp.]
MRTLFGIVLFAALSLQGASPAPKAELSGWCCLCMCHAVDESKCSGECLKMQHSKRIIEEPEMESCTKSCQRQGVKQVHYEQQ